jgi:hypothetical protein
MPSDKPNLQRAAAESPRAEAITDALIMAYIHEISQRHRHGDAPAGVAGALATRGVG